MLNAKEKGEPQRAKVIEVRGAGRLNQVDGLENRHRFQYACYSKEGTELQVSVSP